MFEVAVLRRSGMVSQSQRGYGRLGLSLARERQDQELRYTQGWLGKTTVKGKTRPLTLLLISPQHHCFYFEHLAGIVPYIVYFRNLN